MNLDLLHSQLKRANVTDDMLSRGLRLTSKGTAKLCRKFGISETELRDALAELAQQMKNDLESTGLPMLESDARFAYEADISGNVMLRDTKTGAEKYLSGQDAQLLLAEIERMHPNFQALISPYFERDALREFVEDDVLGVEEDGNTGGSYNFPFKGNFASARFWIENSKPRIEVIALVDQDGEEIQLDAMTKSEATKVAWTWIDKV